MPTYEVTFQTSNGEVPKRVPILEAESKECPRSVVTRNPRMGQLAEVVLEAEYIQMTVGAVEHGTDSSRWPAVWSDLIVAGRVENHKVDMAVRKTKVS